MHLRTLRLRLLLPCLAGLLGAIHLLPGATTPRAAGSVFRQWKTEFFSAIQAGRIEEARMFLESGKAVANEMDEHGVPALYFACEEKRPAIARMLVEHGADVNLRPWFTNTPLQAAIRKSHTPGSEELIRLLIEKGADVNAADDKGNTPLIATVESIDSKSLQLLLQHHVDLGHANADGWTALDLAVAYQRPEMARVLYKAGAPLDAIQQRQVKSFYFARIATGIFPVLLLVCFYLSGVMKDRAARLPRRTAATGTGDDLPRLAELTCPTCGGSASLRPGAAVCSHCHQPVPVPEDYAATLKLRAMTIELVARAERLWQRARWISSAPVRLLLWGIAGWYAWHMASGVFPRFVRMVLWNAHAFTGSLAWIVGVCAFTSIPIAIGGYAIYLHFLNRALPRPPVGVRKAGDAEMAKCPHCAGMVEFRAGDLVAVCGYCGGETYRVALAREARKTAAEEKDTAALSFYQLMFDIYQLRTTAAMAIPVAMIMSGGGLFTVFRLCFLF